MLLIHIFNFNLEKIYKFLQTKINDNLFLLKILNINFITNQYI